MYRQSTRWSILQLNESAILSDEWKPVIKIDGRVCWTGSLVFSCVCLSSSLCNVTLVVLSPALMERVQPERLIMQPGVPQGSFNLEVLRVRSQPQWFLQGKLKEAWSDKKEFQFVICIPSDKCFPSYLCFLGPCFCSAGQSGASTPRGNYFCLWSWIVLLLLFEHFGFFKFK